MSRNFRFYSVEAFQKQEDDSWEPITFRSIAEYLYLTYEGNDRLDLYHHTQEDRRFVKITRVSSEEVFGLFVRSRTTGFPHEEEDLILRPLQLGIQKAVAEGNHFGVFEDNVIVFEQNRSASKIWELAHYIDWFLKKKGLEVDIKFNQLVLEKFRDVLPRIQGLLRLVMRPEKNAIPDLIQESGLDVFRLMGRAIDNARWGQLTLSAEGRRSQRDTFLHDLAEFFKRYLVEEGNFDSFDVLKMTVMLDTGNCALLDISDRHVVQKRIKMPVKRDRTFDESKVYRKIRSVYREKQRILRSEKVYRLQPDYEQVTL